MTSINVNIENTSRMYLATHTYKHFLKFTSSFFETWVDIKQVHSKNAQAVSVHGPPCFSHGDPARVFHPEQKAKKHEKNAPPTSPPGQGYFFPKGTTVSALPSDILGYFCLCDLSMNEIVQCVLLFPAYPAPRHISVIAPSICSLLVGI